MPPLLTETAVKAVKPEQKARKIYDERGLFLFVPSVPASDATKRTDCSPIDPAAKKKAERAAIADTFGALAREYLDTKRSSFNPKTLSKAEWLLDAWLNKYVGKTPVRQITAGDILSVARSCPLTGDGPLLFPSLRSKTRPISNNTINAALRRIGFANDQRVLVETSAYQQLD